MASLALALLACLTLFSYWGVDRCGFVDWDDDEYITRNYRIQSGPNMDNLAWAFGNFRTANWHPLTWMSHALDCRIYGLKPAGHHLTNMLLHMFNVQLVFLLFRTMTRTTWRPFFIAALFAVHPLHVESVAWVSERKDVLSTFFLLLSLLSYAFYSKEKKCRYYIASILLYVCALLSKPMAVTLPVILLLLDYWPLGRTPLRRAVIDKRECYRGVGDYGIPWRRLLIEKTPFILLAFVVCAVTLLSQHTGGAMASIHLIPLGVRIENALVSYVGYLVKTFWPSDLSPFYPYSHRIPVWDWALSGSLMVILLIGVAIRVRKSPYLFTGFLWFAVTLLPVIGIIQVGAQSSADRYTYLPHIGLFAAAIWYGYDLLKASKWPGIVAFAGLCICIIYLSVLTKRQVEYWKDDGTLASRMIQITGGNEVAFNIRALYRLQLGQSEMALADFYRAASFNVKNPVPWVNIGLVFFNKGQFKKAVYYYDLALTFDPKFLNAHLNAGAAYMGLNNLDKAIEHYRAVLDIDPNYIPALYWLGFVLYVAGHVDESRTHLLALLNIQPDNVDALYQLGIIEAKAGNVPKAVRYFEKAAPLSPGSADIRNQLGMSFMKTGDFKRALECFDAALAMDPTHADARINRAGLLAGAK